MSVDLTQFHQVFYEESFEGLDVMESALMALDPNSPDSETINGIFRAAHSIKGGSATFGLNVIAEFTHSLETLLDEIRDGRRAISSDDIDLFLQSVDCLRDLLTSLQNKESPDLVRSNQLKVAFENLLKNGRSVKSKRSKSKAGSQKEAAPAASKASNHWQVTFKAGRDILKTGNDPQRMFRELSTMAHLTIEVDTSALPTFERMDPDVCYLSWRLTLSGAISREQITEVFEWVYEESTIEITQSAEPGQTAQQLINNSISGWSIYFRPDREVLRSGNEPMRMLRDLAVLGTLSVTLDDSALPSFDQMLPEDNYLGWQLQLDSKVEKNVIEKVFEWVADESELTITPLVASAVSRALIDAVNDGQTDYESSELDATQADGEGNSVVSQTNAPPIAKATQRNGGNGLETGSIRVAIDKVDSLINMVGELVITQSMLGQIGSNFSEDQLPRLLEGLSQLEHNTRELQESVMRIRMLPISFAFNRFPRMVRDLSRRLGKIIDLELSGEQTELDKTVMERIGDPLVHLVRNAVDHGIEQPDDRKRAGKPPNGKIKLNAFHQSGNVIIEIIDDGKGLQRDKLLQKALSQGLVTAQEASSFSDAQVYDLIFHPGFSTAQAVSDVSGRGVGMDVVKRNIQELNGTVDIRSEINQGMTVTIRLPLTLAILDGQLVRVGSNTYIFPLVSIVESMQVRDEQLGLVAGGCQVFLLRDEYIPVVRLYDLFNIEPDSKLLKDSLLVVVESEGEKIGVVVDDLDAQQQVVIKSLEQNYQRVEGISGATILGDGTVSLILDVPGMVKIAGVRHIDTNSLHINQRQAAARASLH